MVGLLLSVSGFSVSSPFLLSVQWRRSSQDSTSFFCSIRTKGPGAWIIWCQASQQCPALWGLVGLQIPCFWNTQRNAGKRLLEVIQCCCLLRLQEFVFGLCLLAATTIPKISTGFKKYRLHIYWPAAEVIAANHPIVKAVLHSYKLLNITNTSRNWEIKKKTKNLKPQTRTLPLPFRWLV